MLLAATIKLISNSVVGRLAFLGLQFGWLGLRMKPYVVDTISVLCVYVFCLAWWRRLLSWAPRSYRDRPGAFVLLRHLYLKKQKLR